MGSHFSFQEEVKAEGNTAVLGMWGTGVGGWSREGRKGVLSAGSVLSAGCGVVAAGGL